MDNVGEICSVGLPSAVLPIAGSRLHWDFFIWYKPKLCIGHRKRAIMTEVMSASEVASQSRAGKYLTFALASEEYGLEILKVREIIGYIEVTSVPQTPEYVLGVINLRGQVIPVVNLRSKFGMETIDTTEESCIIVVEIEQDGRSISTGILVDRVQEVLDIAGEAIEPPPEFGSQVDTHFILGMGKIGETVKILLDIDEVLSSDEMANLAGQEAENATVE